MGFRAVIQHTHEVDWGLGGPILSSCFGRPQGTVFVKTLHHTSSVLPIKLMQHLVHQQPALAEHAEHEDCQR